MPEKSEVRKRLEASILPKCPECGSTEIEEKEIPSLIDVTVFKCKACSTVFYTEEITNE